VTYIHNNRTNVVAYVGYSASDKEIIVSFQGTKDARNWLEDFDFQLTNYSKCKGCLVHQGFYFDYLSVHNELIGILTKLVNSYGDSHILVTGSSLGSALATVAALEIELTFRKQT
jgi:putative lipase involved disintegration of autophagic bodies